MCQTNWGIDICIDIYKLIKIALYGWLIERRIVECHKSSVAEVWEVTLILLSIYTVTSDVMSKPKFKKAKV